MYGFYRLMFFFFSYIDTAQMSMSYELPTYYSLKRTTLQIVFTKLDLVQSYYQVPITPKDVQKTRFTSCNTFRPVQILRHVF